MTVASDRSSGARHGTFAAMPRVAVLVLDGTEPSFMEQLIEAGELPQLARLRDRGVSVPLRTPIAYRAEYACTEFLTGLPPDVSRYWGTVRFDPATYACDTIGSARRPPFYADPTSGSVVLFDIPHSVLFEGLPGAQVVGWGGHDARFQHPRASLPAGLMAEIDARFGVDPTAAVEYTGSWHQEWYINALADALVASARRRVDIAAWLLDRHPDWSLFLMGLTEIHAAGHNFGQGVDPDHLLGSHPTAALARERFVEVFRAVDDTVGRITGSLPDGTTTAVMSTKGMRPNRDDLASGVLLPELLYRLASGRPYIHEPSVRAWRRRGCPPVWPRPGDRANDRTRSLAAEGRFARLKRRYHTIAPGPVVRAVGSLRRRVSRTAGPVALPTAAPDVVLPDGTAPVLPGEIVNPATWHRKHWSAMPWFALPSFSDGHVRLNLRGRERDGVIPLDAYERTCDELEAALRLARDARSGEPVVDQVLRMRAGDPLAPDGPGADLVVTWKLTSDAFEHPAAGVVGPFALPRSGSHTDNGFLLVDGPGIPPARLGERPTIDLAPTLLALLGWPKPPGLPGTPIILLPRSSLLG
jgi:predicted AlkP superfamily phosphohydrolase/phosphomutase